MYTLYAYMYVVYATVCVVHKHCHGLTIQKSACDPQNEKCMNSDQFSHHNQRYENLNGIQQSNETNQLHRPNVENISTIDYIVLSRNSRRLLSIARDRVKRHGSSRWRRRNKTRGMRKSIGWGRSMKGRLLRGSHRNKGTG